VFVEVSDLGLRLNPVTTVGLGDMLSSLSSKSYSSSMSPTMPPASSFDRDQAGDASVSSTHDRHVIAVGRKSRSSTLRRFEFRDEYRPAGTWSFKSKLSGFA